MRNDALILAFDTSAAHCAAALLQGETVLAHRVEEMAKGQAERLMPLLEELLAEAGYGWHDLAGLGVGVGPGNFTGVRISVSAARGLALSLGIPAIGVSTFEAVAEGAARPVAVLLDARRGEAYAQRFTQAGADAPRLAPAEILQAELAGTPILGPDQAAFALPVAMARVAASRLGSPQPKPAPLYLRGADAAPPSDPPPVLLD
ncbi:tRNA (adenosine(37)-N6)-threonylcarbamoyltransferase complex dimerization subunit type 1 TsaB [Rhodobacter sp. TJ_12]|uniref:tRNA (adenosine(37)-N6)-threonylcarbamoyltransferase complex dimerization subunit type 1 TsaB n=1 Tax=Rhodobacter sp. TJ_12 TaxID=2029399 RepID=UPI001CBD7725|nr:tRNA (adenosine(37)-N6)-threonylcarbamoyltransferase complex dimerization subunit type 1 TsaB [Rhodobacter sp. TJ_12]MBZ4022577.1 tRNA (adenosine(37)-N6)-threonylcarbamoyltransferase complex dimerization subunit type 1 TsaB [Rhodobacter sp. TJ_12]